jgi:hypothetical protein
MGVSHHLEFMLGNGEDHGISEDGGQKPFIYRFVECLVKQTSEGSGRLNHSHQSVEAVTLKDTRASTPTQDGSPTTAAVDFVDSNLKLNFMNMIDLKPHMKSLLDSYTEIIRLLMVSIRSSVFVHVDTLLLLEQFAR